MRIHRALARAGIASRRKAEELVASGRVLVNGAVARTGQSVDPTVDKISVDGTSLRFIDATTGNLQSTPANAPAFATINGVAGNLVSVRGYYAEGGGPVLLGPWVRIRPGNSFSNSAIRVSTGRRSARAAGVTTG